MPDCCCDYSWDYEWEQFVGGAFVGGNGTYTLAHLLDSGATDWETATPEPVSDICIDSAGNLFLCTLFGGGGNVGVHKYTPAGSQVWYTSCANLLNGICNDGSNSYAVGVGTGANDCRKYNSSGTEITSGWPVEFGVPNSCDCNSSGDVVIVGTKASSTYSVLALDASGSTRWSKAESGKVWNAVRLDASGNAFVGGLLHGGYTLTKYDSSGTEDSAWQLDLGTAVKGIVIDSAGDVLVCGAGKVRKYNGSTKATTWTYTEGAKDFSNLCLDNNDDVYAVSGSAGGPTDNLTKISGSTGSKIGGTPYSSSTLLSVARTARVGAF